MGLHDREVLLTLTGVGCVGSDLPGMCIEGFCERAGKWEYRWLTT